MPPDSFQGIRGVYFGGDMNAAPALAGQSAGLIHGVLSAAQIVDQTVAEFRAIGARLGAMAAAADFG
jgi:enoyl-[acyl-carrier protein] reductase II